jgi:hypothetical protein
MAIAFIPVQFPGNVDSHLSDPHPSLAILNTSREVHINEEIETMTIRR